MEVYYRPQKKLREVNVFTGIYLSTGGSAFPQCHGEGRPLPLPPPGGTSPSPDSVNSLAVCILVFNHSDKNDFNESSYLILTITYILSLLKHKKLKLQWILSGGKIGVIDSLIILHFPYAKKNKQHSITVGCIPTPWIPYPTERTWNQGRERDLAPEIPNPLSSCEQTHAYENITFPQLRWRSAINLSNFIGGPGEGGGWRVDVKCPFHVSLLFVTFTRIWLPSSWRGHQQPRPQVSRD